MSPPDEPPGTTTGTPVSDRSPAAGTHRFRSRLDRADDPTDAHDLVIEAPGIDPVGVVPWPYLARRRLLDVGERVAARVEASGSHQWIVLWTVLFGLFTVGFTITILAVSIPTIARDLNASESTLTWVITAPMLAFAVVGPSAGKLGDIFGHRRVYLTGLALAGVFAGLTAVAWNAGSLIAFRLLGAAFGSSAGPASMALINRVFEPAQRARAMGWWSMVMAGGPVLGVVVGGPIVEQLSWRVVFAAQVPLVAAGVAVAALILPETAPGRRPRFDVGGAVTLAVAMGGLLLALNRIGEWGPRHPAVGGGIVAGVAGLVAFVAIERRAVEPMLPLRWLRTRNFAFPVATQLLLNFAYMGGFILTPLLLQHVLGYGETRTGLLSISRPLAFAIAGPVAGSLAVRVGERTSAAFGAVMVVVSMVLLAQVRPGSPDVLVIAGLALSGLGLGASSPAMAATIANAVEARHLGIAGAAQQMVSQVGTVVGIQVLQTVQALRAETAGPVTGYHDAYLVGAAVAALGILTALGVRSSREEVPARGDAPRRSPAAVPVAGDA